jgi:hypothetical protein
MIVCRVDLYDRRSANLSNRLYLEVLRTDAAFW